MNKPTIYSFHDVIEFLKAVISFEQNLDANMSLRKWAKKYEMNDQDLLLILKNKKKISQNFTENMILSFQLDDKESVYLRTLVKISHAESTHEKNILQMLLLEQRSYQGTMASVEDQSLFSHWVHMAILSMSRLKTSSKLDREMIQEMLIDSVSSELIDEAIERLFKLGLLKFEEGRFNSNFDNTISKNDAYKKSPHLYFEQVAELAKRGSRHDASEREFQCLSVPINHKLLPEFKEMIRNFRVRVCNLAQTADPDQVFQLNVQFFPLSKRIDSSFVEEVDVYSQEILCELKYPVPPIETA